MRKAPVIKGTPVRSLPEEQVIRTITDPRKERTIYLTNRRLIYFGRERVAFIFPGDESLQVAMLSDVNYVGSFAKRLSGWLLAAGLSGVIGGFMLIVAFGAAAFLLVLAGGGLIALWTLYKGRFLSFAVSGAELLRYRLALPFAPLDMREVDDFVSDFFRLKEEAMERPFQRTAAVQR